MRAGGNRGSAYGWRGGGSRQRARPAPWGGGPWGSGGLRARGRWCGCACALTGVATRARAWRRRRPWPQATETALYPRATETACSCHRPCPGGAARAIPPRNPHTRANALGRPRTSPGSAARASPRCTPHTIADAPASAERSGSWELCETTRRPEGRAERLSKEAECRRCADPGEAAADAPPRAGPGHPTSSLKRVAAVHVKS
jgi:hypothetical protein